MSELVTAGAVIRTAFCGPCFGAGDVPANEGFSIRHTTRNFPNREGSKPKENQSASVGLMDARSIAVTAANGGIIKGADTANLEFREYDYYYDNSAYVSRVYNGWAIRSREPLLNGPNIKDWPNSARSEDLLLFAALLTSVTTTDELIRPAKPHPSSIDASGGIYPVKKDPDTLRGQAAVNDPIPVMSKMLYNQ